MVTLALTHEQAKLLWNVLHNVGRARPAISVLDDGSLMFDPPTEHDWRIDPYDIQDMEVIADLEDRLWMATWHYRSKREGTIDDTDV